MKKIIIATAVAALSIVTHAAAISWTIANENPSAFANQYVYAVSASDYANALDSLNNKGGKDWINTFAIANSDAGTDYQKKLNVRGGGSASTVLNGADKQFALFIFTDGIAEGKTYYTTGLIGGEDYLYTPPAQAENVLSLGTSSSAFSTTGTIKDVPEPTSGLLLLVGVAGLALRRRRG